MKTQTSYFIKTKLIPFLFCFVFFSQFSFAATQDQISMVKKAAEQKVSDVVSPPVNGSVKFSVQHLDSRLKLTDCLKGLTTSIPGKQSYKNNVTVLVSCPADNWQLYVPVKITELIPMIIAKRTLSKGTPLSTADMETKLLNNKFIQGQIFQDINNLIGSRVKQTINAGSPITGRNICLVCKNDPVTIKASDNGLIVKAKGTALNDGSLNDVVKVKNIKSNRIVNGRVTKVGEVSVDF